MTGPKRGDPVSVTITGTLADLFIGGDLVDGPPGPVIQLSYAKRPGVGGDLFIRADEPAVQIRRLVPEGP